MMPRGALLRWAAVAGMPLLVGPLVPECAALGVALTFAVALVALIDLLITPRLRLIEVYRESRGVLSVGARNPVTVTLRNRGTRPVVVTVHDEPPQPSRWFDLPLMLELPPQRTVTAVYGVEPHQRGRNAFGTLSLRMVSRLGLWLLQDDRPLPQALKIYPDIQSVRQIELLARQNRLAEAGVRLSRLRGRGSDFDRLREYRREDEYRNIDWKATARHQDLISREYVVERNQNLLLLLDTGRSMCNDFEGVSHFDRALNAAMLLAYVALRQGDTVGLLAGSATVDRWAKPVRGRNGVEKLIGQVYDLVPNYSATDYDRLFQELRQSYRKRSLVILITHALDDVHLRTITDSLKKWRQPHLVLAAFLKNVALEDRASAIPESDLDAFQIVAAAEMTAAQHEALATVQQSGLLVVDCLPTDLSSRLISRYLDIKARHLL
ncbi:MAG TPA: DUF58 domain-containing protein [Planctomycetaceae bacterium]|nr:DUF58 domain-containing protein [Planctomycetaceae bacterium]